MHPEFFVELVVKSVLLPDKRREFLFKACLPDLPGHDKIVLKRDISL